LQRPIRRERESPVFLKGEQHIARNFTALAGQLEMLSIYMVEESRK